MKPGKLRLALTMGVAAQMLIATQFATMAQAEMISTDLAIERHAAQANRAVLLEEVRRSDVRQEMIELGVDPAEAEARLAALTDAEVSRMLAQMDEDSAGAGAIGTIGMIFLILLVTDLLCLTRLFNFTRCVR